MKKKEPEKDFWGREIKPSTPTAPTAGGAAGGTGERLFQVIPFSATHWQCAKNATHVIINKPSTFSF
jgi:hypothetical protein